MRILRLALRHYRGLEACEVAFAPRGVTIVQGPNEVGKSSLAEALDLLLEEHDGTTKQRVREVQPVDRDESAEVEADMESGPYAFTYRKRFHRRPATHLVLHRPHVVTLTGREAHERVCAILEETLDVALWRALRLQQGEPLAQPEIGGAPTLAAALDRAVGASGGGAREESLFERARVAFERFYTPTGRPRRELTSAEREAGDAREAEQALREALDALEQDALREQALQREVAELEQRVWQAREELRSLDAELETLRALREELTRLEARRDATCAEEREAAEATRRRSQLAAEHEAKVAEIAALGAALEREAPGDHAAEEACRRLDEELRGARDAEEAAVQRVEAARRDAEHGRDERELAALRERAARAAHEEREAAAASEILAGPPLDAARVRRIGDAQGAVERARARLDAEGPTLHVVPERDLEVEIDGERVHLPAGEETRRRISASLVLSLPGVGALSVVAGAGTAERRKSLEETETALRALCAEAGVDDHAGAVAALETRRSAERALAECARRRAEALGDHTPAALAARIARLEERVACRAAAGSVGTDETEAALAEAERGAARARAATEGLVRRAEEERERLRQREAQRRAGQTCLEQAERRAAQLAAQLADARAEAGDEALAARRDGRAVAARELEAQAREASAQLAARAPKESERRAAAARTALERDERRLRERRDALLGLAARLEAKGSEGLFERWDAARLRRERAERVLTALRRRAAAARRLFETLCEERAAARRSYAAPLAEEIAALGRPLFGPSFGVELSDDLAIERRVLEGRSLALRQLSAGAREQLGLLARLAAARLAGGGEGAPVLLDDALGHTDPQRLDALGRILAAAARDAQVVVLTCAPERFRSVEGARVVELR